jgi:hypothetical protein
MGAHVKVVIGMIVIFGTITMFLWNNAPRLMRDSWYARDFVPAQGHRLTNYKCTNWNGFMFNECTVTYVSPQSRESQEFTDWRFGRAPTEPVRLMQRRGDASTVTTDVSLQTLWNRMALGLTLVLFGVFLTATFIIKAMRGADESADESDVAEPKPQGSSGAFRSSNSANSVPQPRSDVSGFGRRTERAHRAQ